ncbi:hypothetical protein [uncultured Campylobacter sp.]|uniref:hypothetical protein n=1 Tax=uncultured Campylobacter sp. TaxID=218934 RepID=UPI003211ABA7
MNEHIIQNPHQIYNFIDNTVNKILSDLDKKSENEAVQGSKERVLKIVSSFKNQTLDNAISELKKNSEWDKLVIAFYGETNAGKSTLIEALRIYLGEIVKTKNMSKFNELKQKFGGLSVEKIRKIQENKEKLDDQEKTILVSNEQNRKTLINRLRLFLISFKRIFLNKEVCEMIELADGAIIGDGRPDFTRKSTSYEFDDFILIDLPGIEGSEEKVIEEILESVKRAHAVFYVTSSVTPPQKGENNKKGTIEKIKEHLSDQSEVYALFNKRINSHHQLKENLLNEGEQKSLLVVDEKMREIIGDSYASHKVVSAKIAFLGVAECLLEGSKAAQDRAKFLDKFDKNELINRSNLDEFGLFLQNELADNAQKKIKKSNFYKANSVLKQLIDVLKDILCNNILPLKEMLMREYQDAKNNINTAFLSLKNGANIDVDKEIENFRRETRNSIYDYIDKDVSNDDFKRKLEYLLNQNVQNLQNKLPNVIKSSFNEFESMVQQDLSNFARKANETINELQSVNIGSFSVNIDIKSGVDKMGLLGSAVGAGGLIMTFALTNAWNPMGWAAFGVGVVTVMVSFLKSVWGWFDSDYKKSQQRQKADDNIHKVANRIKNNITPSLDKNLEEIRVVLDEITANLYFFIQSVQTTEELFIENIEKLENVFKSIKNLGGKDE